MPETASDVLVEGLIAWGVDIVFGLPGDGINGIMEALRTRQARSSRGSNRSCRSISHRRTP